MKVIQQVQKAFYEALTNTSTGVSSDIEGVFYLPPDNTNTPYVIIGNIISDNVSDFINEVYRIKATIKVFDISTSNENILTIMEEVKNILLNIDNMTTTDYDIIEAMQNEASVDLVDSSKLWKGLLAFEFYVKGK